MSFVLTDLKPLIIKDFFPLFPFSPALNSRYFNICYYFII